MTGSGNVSKMGSIYRDSFLTLAATASADGSGGMLRERHTSYHNIPIQLAEPGPSVTIGSRPLYTHSTLSPSQEGDPLSRRAWAFQERLLARRILHFTSHELLWECKTKQQCECLGWTASQGDILQGEKLAFEDMAQGSNLESVIVQRNPCFLLTWQYSTRQLIFGRPRTHRFSTFITLYKSVNYSTTTGSIDIKITPF
jgi:hypothetical protein